jgi:hypothetical protein
MAITFPITGVTTTYSATRSPAFTLGTSPLTNDILVAFISSTTTSATTDVATWTNALGADVEIMPSDTTLACVMVYHRVTAAEDTADQVTWTLTNLWDATETGRISVAVLRGVATTGELVGTGSTSNAGNSASPFVIADITPTADGSQIMAGVAGDGTATLTTPGTHTLQAGAGTTQTNYLYSDDTLGSNGVATGTTDVTPSAGNEYVSIVAAFKDAAVSATISATVVTATGAAVAPTVAVGSTITGTVVTGTGASLAPSAVSAGTGADITATVVTATGNVPTATAATSTDASITATVVTAFGEIPGVPSIRLTEAGDSRITEAGDTRVTESGGGESVSVGSTVTAVVVTATGETLAATVTTSANVSITADVVTATGETLAATAGRAPYKWAKTGKGTAKNKKTASRAGVTQNFLILQR